MIIRKCENCVFGFRDKVDNYYLCKPLLPKWIKIELSDTIDFDITRRFQCEVDNTYAEDCEAFRRCK